MKGKWVNIAITPEFSGAGHRRMIQGRAYYNNRVCVPNEVDAQEGSMGLIYMADFIYLEEEQQVIKNRIGTVEDLYNLSRSYMDLKYHPNEQVRKLFEKVETLAALAED